MQATTFAEQQAQTAAWMGYASAEEMNAAHDPLHRALCRWLGIESMAMREAEGEVLGDPEKLLAGIEEDAVLSLQRFICHAGVGVPKS